MKTCYNCKHRIIDSNGDRCEKGDFPLMDSRFNYEYELLKLRNSRPCYCPLAESENEE